MKTGLRNRFSKALSLVLSIVIFSSTLPVSVFANTITEQGLWKIDNSENKGVATFGDTGFTYFSETTTITSGNTNGKDYVKSNNSNGSASDGIVVTTDKSYCSFTPTANGTLTVYVGNAATKSGYVSRTNISTNESEAVGNFVPGGKDVNETGFKVTQGTTWATVDVEVSTGYTYYFTLSGSKMFCYGAEFAPYTNVSGAVTDTTNTFNKNNTSIIFKNNETLEINKTEIVDGKYSIALKPNYSYLVNFTGEDALKYKFTDDTKVVEVLQQPTQEVNLSIENCISYNVSGKITGLNTSYKADDLKVIFVPEDTASFESINATIDNSKKSNRTFSANLIANQKYTVLIDGAYDYTLANEVSVTNDKNTSIIKDIELKKVPTYKVTGNFLGLTDVRGEYETLKYNPTSITFTNINDNYTYTGTIQNGKYNTSLRSGNYLASIKSKDYSTSTHVVVTDKEVTRDLLLKDLTPSKVVFKDTVTVGADKEYKSVTSAINAISNMTRSKNERVTVKIDPGVYREQVVINVPNVTLESNGGTKEDTKITWYYGIGYKYYSCVDSYYDPYADYDKFEKGNVINYWGSAVITNVDATGFRANNITFENSFNKYMTDEELVDGVELNGLQGIQTVRKENTNVQTKAATERGAAYVNYADKTEFLNCAFIGSQDTLYTSNTTSDAYYKNCYIEGQTDFIYGNGDVIFDGCEINFCGYDGTGSGGYLTANSSSDKLLAEDGYIFRSCYISYNDTRTKTPGYFGRMWGNSAKVAFLNSALEEEDMIVPEGFTEMSGNSPTSDKVTLKEYNTTYNGNLVDTSKRVNKPVSNINFDDYSVEKVFIEKGFTPYYYKKDDTSIPTFKTEPSFISNGDLNSPNPGETITVSYSLKDSFVNGDASRISWYAVEKDFDKTNLSTVLKSSTLLKTTSVVSSNSFQIPMEATDKYIMAVVTPLTNYGRLGESKYIINTQKVVSDTWSDPTNEGSIAPGSETNIFLAGDSTVKDYSINGMYNGGSIIKEGSWGEYLQYFLDKDFVTVNNYAQGGRSSRSFINEGKLKNIENNIKEGDYLFIQFGHNDGANGNGYYEERFVPLFTEKNPKTAKGYPTVLPTESMKVETPSAFKEAYGDKYYSWDCGATYKGYLQYYVNMALEKGATPVIITPVSRLYYNEDGTIKPHHDATMTDYEKTIPYITENNAYVTACKEVYEENKNKGVLFIDGFTLTKDLYEKAYKDGGSDKNGVALMSVGDKTHSNKTGGVIQAGIIAKQIQNSNMTVASKVIEPKNVYGENPDGQYIFTIKDFKFTAKDTNYELNKYWTDYGQKLFDSINTTN